MKVSTMADTFWQRSPSYEEIYQCTGELEELERLVLTYMDHQGFEWPDRESMPRALMLVISELAEALEEIRHDRWILSARFDVAGRSEPIGFPIEIAHALIRLLHITAAMKLSTRDLVTLTLGYGKTRPWKHGKVF